MRLTFGGMMRAGRPVNLNQQLSIEIAAGAGGIVNYVLTRTYWDPKLVDPMTP